MSKRFAASGLASSAAKAKAEKDGRSGNQVESKTITTLPSDSSEGSQNQTSSTAESVKHEPDSAKVETAPMTKKESVTTPAPYLPSLLASSTLTPTSGDTPKPMDASKKSRLILSSIASKIKKPPADAGQNNAKTTIDSGGASNSLASIAQRIKPSTVIGSEEADTKSDGAKISESRDSAVNTSSALSSFAKRIQSSQQQSSTADVPPEDLLAKEKTPDSQPSVMSSKASNVFTSFTQKRHAPAAKQKDLASSKSSDGSPAEMFSSFASRIKKSQASSVLKKDETSPDNPESDHTKSPEKKMGFSIGTSIAFSGLSSRLNNKDKPEVPTIGDASNAGKDEAELSAVPKKLPDQKATGFTASLASMRTQTLFSKKEGSSKTADQSIDKAKESVTQAFASFGKFISTIDDPKAHPVTKKRWKDKDELISFDDGEDSAETTNESNQLFDPSHDSMKGVLTNEL